MAYEKPVLVTLSFATTAIGSGNRQDADAKQSGALENNVTPQDGRDHPDPNGGGPETSSGGGAYEADE